MEEHTDINKQLSTIKENLLQQSYGLQKLGRALTQEEENNIQRWNGAASFIQKALDVLEGKGKEPIFPIS